MSLIYQCCNCVSVPAVPQCAVHSRPCLLLLHKSISILPLSVLVTRCLVLAGRQCNTGYDDWYQRSWCNHCAKRKVSRSPAPTNLHAPQTHACMHKRPHAHKTQMEELAQKLMPWCESVGLGKTPWTSPWHVSGRPFTAHFPFALCLRRTCARP